MTIRHWLVFAFVFAACGDGDNGHRAITDAPAGAPDSAIDASELGLVSVKVIDGTSNVPVYFQNADGSLVAKVMTDTNGVASTMMKPGGNATIVFTYTSVPAVAAPGVAPTRYQLFTWEGVQANDTLLISGEGSGSGSGTTPSLVTVTIPTVSNALSYIVNMGCGGYGSAGSAGGATTTVQLTEYCAKDDLQVVALDGSNQPISSFAVADVTIQNMGAVDLSASTYAAPTTRVVEIDHNTDTVYSIDGSTRVQTPNGSFYGTSLAFPATDPALDVVTQTETLLAAPATHRNVIYLEQGFNGGYRETYRWGVDGNVAIDWVADLVPTFDVLPTFDAGTQKLSWTATTGGAEAQVYLFGMSATRSTYQFVWDVAGPGDGTYSIKAPALPTDIADFSLGATDGLDVAAMANIPGGYDTIRPSIAYGPPSPPANAATGKLSVALYYGNRELVGRTAKSRSTLHGKARHW